MLTTPCPKCGTSFAFQPEHIGKRGQCKNCQNIFPIVAPQNTALRSAVENTAEEEARQRAGDLRKQRELEEAESQKLLKHLGIGAAIIAGIIALGIAAYFLTRDTWEKDNKARLVQVFEEANAIKSSRKMDAFEKYETIVREAGDRPLKDQQMRRVVEESKKLKNEIYAELADQIEEKRKAEENRKAEDARRQLELERQREEAQRGEEARIRAEKERQAEMQRRMESYAQYQTKTQSFYDSLLRTSSDLEVGINISAFQERVRDMNFAYNKWAGSLSQDEVKYPSARLMEAILNCYVKSSKYWSSKIDKSGSIYMDSMMQWEWKRATILLIWVKDCMQKRDVVEEQKCLSCAGTGQLACPICNGTGKCSLCRRGNGTQEPNDYNICCDNGVCKVCHGTKIIEKCPVCMGVGFFPKKP